MSRIPAAERRAALVEAAIRVVAREGIAHATTRAIVAEAEMSLASFHYAFESRDELIDEVIRTVVAREQQAVVPDAIDGDEDLRAILEAGLLRYLEHLRAEPARELAMLELTLYALRSPERYPLAVMQYARYTELAAEALEVAAQAAGARWLLPVRDVARTLVAFTDGLTTTWLVDRDEEAARRVVVAAADALSRMAEPA
ncbi:TetR/AcrR family transcriptional regulator [Agromyces sp. MMS24-K17]|uniref:TetR/AcrR family transcriptional regulator n=1 Tax=Agromyces sp. MMS24-K17 TaxID=3372850 RepID=UPI00375529D0